MLVWEAHRDLAASLGDSCNITSSTIYDGARFPKKNRDSYLYRAILEIMRQVLQSVSLLPKSRIADYIKLLFPNLTMELKIPLGNFDTKTIGNTIIYSIDLDSYCNMIDGNNSKPLYLMTVWGGETKVDGSYAPVPLPLKQSLVKTGSINSRITQKADAFSEKVMQWLNIYDNYGSLDTGSEIYIEYLPYPRNPANATVPVIPKPVGSYEYTDNLDIEESMLQKMFSYALLYAMTDDQNADNQGLITAQIQLTQNQPIQPRGE